VLRDNPAQEEPMKRLLLVCGLIGLAFTNALQAQVSRLLFASLRGVNEVPVVSTPATGQFAALIDDDAQTIEYEMNFQGLQAAVTQSHIHIAQENVNGGIVLWLCGTASNPGPAGTQVCPQSGRISGVLRASDIQAQAAQGIAPNEFAEVARAIRGGFAYANIHTVQSAGGEIRGQINSGTRP
jgi:hypothetical protein